MHSVFLKPQEGWHSSAAMDVCFRAQLHICPPPLFDIDPFDVSQPPRHSAGHLKSVCGSLERLMSGLRTWWSGVPGAQQEDLGCSDSQLSSQLSSTFCFPACPSSQLLQLIPPHSLLVSWQLTGLCSYGDAALPMGHSLTLEH